MTYAGILRGNLHDVLNQWSRSSFFSDSKFCSECSKLVLKVKGDVVLR